MIFNASSVEEAHSALQKGLRYPVLIIPWGEFSGKPHRVALNSAELEAALQAALADALYEEKVHLISRCDCGRFWEQVKVIENPIT